MFFLITVIIELADLIDNQILFKTDFLNNTYYFELFET